MAWYKVDVVPAGQYVMGEVLNGVSLDVFTSTSENDILTAARLKATGWNPVQVVWQRGVFGLGESLRIYGQVTTPTASEVIASQMADAVNSFWFVAGASASVSASDSLITSETPQDSLAQSLKWVATAAIVVALVWGVYQVRKAIQ